jgi:hypothetical protein
MRTHLLSVAVGVTSIALVFLLPPRMVGLAGVIYSSLGPLHAAHGWWSHRTSVEAKG